ncbi:MAG: lytic polysaccharide monooxygenase [Polyangiaceae bacterium]|nr:lytic polysaccharide monooxygenase [Polyangiaceae bacterium]
MKHHPLKWLFVAAIFSVGSTAQAHTVLTKPAPLSGDDNAKSGPCGCYFGDGPEDPTEDGTPLPCPTDYTVTELVAGSQVTVEWKETVNHNGDFRIAFSAKSPEQTLKADVDANIIETVPDQNGTSGATLKQTITIPNEPCELCTIQLRQFMIGAAQPYYYSCAAVKIVDPNAGTGGAGTGGSSSSASTGGSGGSGGEGTSTTAQTVSTGAGMADPEPTVAEGCAVTNPRAATRTTLFLAGVALALQQLRRKFRRSQRR